MVKGKFLISKIYSSDGGTIHFKNMCKTNNSELFELTRIKTNFFYFELFRRSIFGKFLRKLGLMVYIELLLGRLVRFELEGNVLIPTDSLLFLKICSSLNHVSIISYDLPWSYYDSNIRKVKQQSVNLLKKYQNIYCISQGMFEIYEELGLDNLVLINDFTRDLKPLREEQISQSNFSIKKPLYIGNIRFMKEMNELLSVIDDKILHFGKDLKIQRFNNQGFFEDIISELEILNGEYFGLCCFSFETKDKDLARSSIPSKLITYNLAGIPVLFYGPEYSEGYKLCKKNHLGICASSIEELKEIVNC